MPVFSTTCVYGLTDPRTAVVRYIGKTTRGMKRVHEHNRHLNSDPSHKGNWLRQLRVLGLVAGVVVLEAVELAGLDSAERVWISWARTQGWPLTNLTDGGDGRNGSRQTDATRARIAAALRGRATSTETRSKLSKANIGKKMSAEAKAKIGAAHRGKAMSSESRAKMSAAHTGVPRSEEAKARMRAGWARRRANLLQKAACNAASI